MNVPLLISVLKRKGFVTFERPYEMNIVGVRSDSNIPNRFDDSIHVFYRTGPKGWYYKKYPATTDPGTYWLHNPMNPQGTSILAQGQYRNAYRIGLHQGKYTALVQRGPVKVIRDYDRNAVLDFFNGQTVTGVFGINIHRASVHGTTKYVDRYSAGCQVFANIYDFEEFLNACEKHRSLYGNSFTYTLIDNRAIRREHLRKLVIAGTFAAIGFAGLLLTAGLDESKPN